MGVSHHNVPYETDDRHHHDAADAATDYITAHAEHAATGIKIQTTQNELEYLATDAAAHDPGYAVADSAQTKILEERTAEISPDSAQHEFNDQTQIHKCLLPFRPPPTVRRSKQDKSPRAAVALDHVFECPVQALTGRRELRLTCRLRAFEIATGQADNKTGTSGTPRQSGTDKGSNERQMTNSPFRARRRRLVVSNPT
jgi:hypothetical protein